MPIEDYDRLAEKAENRIFNNPKIDEDGKRYLRRFLTAYDVSSARKSIFLTKIGLLLETFKPIESALTERDRMNDFFASLRKKYSPATYTTYIGVVQRFLTWMNDGEKPVSMKDIRKRKGRHVMRDLKPEDMLTWDEGVLLSDYFCNVQMKAAVLTQLDCGFRPSEFIDLNYGDVEIHTGLVAIKVRGGKTGGRSVVAQRCVPALLKWMDTHPGKQPGDPLWIFEANIKSGLKKRLAVKRYRYPALAKRIRIAGRNLEIKKPLDFYSLRHSSCVLDKMDNLPVDLAAERHGHSVKHYVGTYGRLSVQDVVRRFNSHYGSETDQEEPKKVKYSRNCPACRTLNSGESDWCMQCGTPLNTKGALEAAQKQGLLSESGTESTSCEVEQMKAELAASREREKGFREEQMILLRQVQEIRDAIAKNSAI